MADRFAPNKRWHIDTIIRVLKLVRFFFAFFILLTGWRRVTRGDGC